MSDMSVERVIENAVDRDAMHRLIDELPDDSLAVLCAQEGPDGDTRWHLLGDTRFRAVLGLIEATKQLIVHSYHTYHARRDDDD